MFTTPLVFGVLASAYVFFCYGNRPKRSVLAGLLTAVATGIIQPVINPSFYGFWLFLAVIVLFISLGPLALRSRSVGGKVPSLKDAPGMARKLGVAAGGLVAAIAFLVLPLAYDVVFGSEFLRASSYSGLLGKITDKTFDQAVMVVDSSGVPQRDGTILDQSDVRLVDEGIATMRGHSLLSSDRDLGGTYMLGRMSLTRMTDGRQVWAAPIEYTGPLRWLQSGASPGYVWVDAHDSRNGALVRDVGGKPVAMRCIETAYGWQNVEYVAWAASPTRGLTDFSFELDSSGRPFIVATAFDHAVALGGDTPTGVVIVDTQTCEARFHAIGTEPAWVNRVVPESIAHEQVAAHERLAQGWYNQSWGSHKDVNVVIGRGELVPTSPTSMAWLFGLAMPGNSRGTVGFMLVDSRTKQATRIVQPGGLNEYVAQSAIEGKVSQNKGWTISFPVSYNFAHRATYLSIIKDAGGNPKQIGLMPVDDNSTVVTADNLPTALAAYVSALAEGSVRPGNASPNPVSTYQGTISRITQTTLGGETYLWLLLADHPGLVFKAAARIGPQVALMEKGDAVQLQAQDTGDGIKVVGAARDAAVMAGSTLPALAKEPAAAAR